MTSCATTARRMRQPVYSIAMVQPTPPWRQLPALRHHGHPVLKTLAGDDGANGDLLLDTVDPDGARLGHGDIQGLARRRVAQHLGGTDLEHLPHRYALPRAAVDV